MDDIYADILSNVFNEHRYRLIQSHTGALVYQCSTCEQEFKNADKWLVHYNKHNANFNNRYVGIESSHVVNDANPFDGGRFLPYLNIRYDFPVVNNLQAPDYEMLSTEFYDHMLMALDNRRSLGYPVNGVYRISGYFAVSYYKFDALGNLIWRTVNHAHRRYLYEDDRQLMLEVYRLFYHNAIELVENFVSLPSGFHFGFFVALETKHFEVDDNAVAVDDLDRYLPPQDVMDNDDEDVPEIDFQILAGSCLENDYKYKAFEIKLFSDCVGKPVEQQQEEFEAKCFLLSIYYSFFIRALKECPKLLLDNLQHVYTKKRLEEMCFNWEVVNDRSREFLQSCYLVQGVGQLVLGSFDFTKCVFPMDSRRIENTFSRRNRHVNVVCFYLYKAWEGKSRKYYNRLVILSSTLSKLECEDDFDKTVFLLLYNRHYYVVYDVTLFLNKTCGGKGNRFFCLNCCVGFCYEIEFKLHYEICMSNLKNNSMNRYVLNTDKKCRIDFVQHKLCEQQPFYFVYDLEANAVEPSMKGLSLDVEDNAIFRGAKVQHTQRVNAIGIQLVDQTSPLELNPRVIIEVAETDSEECSDRLIEKLWHYLESWCKICETRVNVLYNRGKRQITREERARLLMDNVERRCRICLKRSDEDYFYWSYLYQTYLYLCHKECYEKAFILPKDHKVIAFAHNAGNYDMQLLLRKPGAVDSKGVLRASVLCAGVGRRYKTIDEESRKGLRWSLRDSMSLISTSLSNAMSLLKKDQFCFLTRELMSGKCKKWVEKNGLMSLLKKGIFPYDWSTSNMKLRRQKKFVERRFFYSRLKDSMCSVGLYNEAKKVYEETGMESMMEYLKLYLTIDTTGLADLIRMLSRQSYENYTSDLTKAISSSQYSYNCFIRSRLVGYGFIRDVIFYALLTKGKRGGMVFVNQRMLTNSEKRSMRVFYIDVNSLYPTVMCKFPLLNGDNARVYYAGKGEDVSYMKSIVEKLKNTSIEEGKNDSVGYVVCVDLDYPVELHERDNMLPLAPEKSCVRKEWVCDSFDKSKYCDHASDKFCAKKKLLATCFDKKYYVCHSLMLQFLLNRGMKLRKVHCIIECGQDYKSASYMEELLRKRKESRERGEEIDSELLKLLANSAFGYTIMNKEAHTKAKTITLNIPVEGNDGVGDVKIDTKGRILSGLSKHSRKLEASIKKELSDDLLKDIEKVGVDTYLLKFFKTECLLSNPTYVGFTVLDLSKLYMYQMRFCLEDIMKDILKKHGIKFVQDRYIYIMYTDTDSFILRICDKYFEEFRTEMYK